MNATNDEPAERFTVKTTADSHFSWIRTRLSMERTLMAWVRTAVSLIGFGFTIVQFFERLQDMQGVAPAARPGAPRYLGLALIASGVLVLLISVWQYRGGVRYLWSDQFKPLSGFDAGPMKPVVEQTPALAVSLTLIFIGLFAFFAVATRMV